MGSTLARRWLARTGAAAWLPLLAVLLASPSLFTGLQLDDFVLQALLTEGSGFAVAPWEAFGFFRQGAPQVDLFRESGVLPWWTAEDFHAAFFRPLSSLTHWLDFRLWPASPVLMHIQSLGWLALLVFLAGRLYRRLHEQPGEAWSGSLALLLFAVEDAHGQAAGWISARNGLVAGCFGFLALLLHDRWRRGGFRAGALLAPGAWLLGLLAGEGALGAGAYLAAHALFLDRAPGWRRLAALLPHGLVAAGWGLAYRLGGFGVGGSGMYSDPVHEPATFLRALPERLSLLAWTQWSFPPAEFAILRAPAAVGAVAVGGALLVALLAALAWPLLRREARARFWACGSMLSLLPVATTLPAGRLLVFPGLGAMALVARWLAANAEGAPWLPAARWPRRAWRAAATALGLVHLVLSPLLLPLMAASPAIAGRASLRALTSLPATAELPDRDLVIVNAPDYLLFAGYLPSVRSVTGQARPAHLRALATGPVPLEVRRLDETTLLVASGGGFPAGVTDGVYWIPGRLRAGDRVRLAGMEVEVREVAPDGRVRAAAFRFTAPLETYLWYEWREGVYAPFALPPVGRSVALGPARLPF